jgi:hypothetical protein
MTVSTQNEYFIRSLWGIDVTITNIEKLRYEIENRSDTSEEERKAQLILERMECVLTSAPDCYKKFDRFTSWIIPKKPPKWPLSITSPFFSKIIELIEYMIRNSIVYHSISESL